MNKLFVISFLCLSSMNVNCYFGDDLSGLSKEDKEYSELKKRHAKCLENLSKCPERELNIVQRELVFSENQMAVSNTVSSIVLLIGLGLVLHSCRSGSPVGSPIECGAGVAMILAANSHKYDLEVESYKKAVELELDERKKHK